MAVPGVVPVVVPVGDVGGAAGAGDGDEKKGDPCPVASSPTFDVMTSNVAFSDIEVKEVGLTSP